MKRIVTMFMILAAVFVLFSDMQAIAAEYYVDRNHPQAGDTNPGTKDAPWLTIGRAEDVATNPGDVVYVRSGTYDERVTCQHSGNAGSGYINFVGYPGDAKPIMRGFEIQDQSYIRIIGFEITHNSLVYNHGIMPGGSCNHLEILDNYIHDVRGHAVRWYNQDVSYVTVRGNEMYMAGCPSGVPGECSGNGWAVQMAGGSHNLIEYNQAHRVGDYINIHTLQSIVRNNFLHDFQNSYWPDGLGDGLHADMFQPTGSETFPSNYQVYESNFMGDNVELNSHILQMRSTFAADHHIVFRGNVGFNHGSYAMQCGGIDNVYYYNNTLHNINTLTRQSWPASGMGYNAEGTNYSLNNHNFNNIISDIGSGPPIYIQAGGNSCASSNNLCHLTGSHASCVSTSNPLFVDSGSHDYHLQSGSPAIGLGKAVTNVTSPGGSGTSFNVADAGFFCDGYGIAEGDIIKVGGNNPARIIAVNANTITVDRSITWNNGDGVYWKNQDTSPDIGAYEYRANGDGFAIEIIAPTDQGNVSGLVPIAAGLTNTENVRFVVFYIDGIPAAKVTESPYAYTWNTTSLEQGSRHLIEARAYALHATPHMTESDQIVVMVGPPIPPQAPSELYIISVTSSSVRLGWPDSTGAFGYRIYRDGQPVGNTMNNRYTDAGLIPETTYNYTVTALGAGTYESGAAGPVSAVTSPDSGNGGDSGGEGGGGGGGCFIATVAHGSAALAGMLPLFFFFPAMCLFGRRWQKQK